MSMLNGLRRLGRRVATAATATLAAAALVVGGAAPASATPNREHLRPGCTWDGARYWVQRCEVFSPAMGRNIIVQIQPSKFGGDGALYLLDGLRAPDDASGWIKSGVNPQAMFVDDNINVVMPVGGQSSFYADWTGDNAKFDPRAHVNYKWETFLTSELPDYLARNFAVNGSKNSIAGLSMGAVGALNIAAKHPERFRQVLSYSGYPTMTLPGSYAALTAVLIDGGWYNVHQMYGSVLNPRRFENDPYLNMAGLKGLDVYLSAGTGVPSPNDIIHGEPRGLAMGTALEATSRQSTLLFEAKARANGLNVTSAYPPLGIHSWWLWGRELEHTRQRILDALS